MPDLHPANPLTPQDLLGVLELIASRVPDRHVTPDAAMAKAWLRDLSRFDRLHVLQAAMTWDGEKFPAAAQFIGRVQEVAREAIAEEARRHGSTGRCPACDGSLLVEIAEFDESPGPGPVHEHGTCRPCHMCNRDAYDRWRTGHYAPDHECGDCKAIRKGRSPAAAG